MTGTAPRPARGTEPEQRLPGSAFGARSPEVIVRRLGIAPYEQTWRDMRMFTAARTPTTADELWLLQHPAVYTLGLAGRAEHLPANATGIPVISVDRGGQVTYHGPGQIVVYTLIDINRKGIGVRTLVQRLEQSVIDLLARYAVPAHRRQGAPGVYVNGAKIAALGLRIRGGRSYHGLSFNVDMDLAPFMQIDPCGYPGLLVTQARDLGIMDSVDTLGEDLVARVQSNLEITKP